MNIKTSATGTSISELQALPLDERLYRCRERLEHFHASFLGGYNWQAVLEDKWTLATMGQGGTL